ncbi:phBC6A51 family helix-turn-helix protein [Tenacibaculum aiptasiae]|uniref:phBC6A51 family helix-turn-helix protein n=1 Tax=Tenacibaculum aiptasiae TaxID=426481 RepID=UPI003B59B050
MQHFLENLKFENNNLSTRIKKKQMVKAMYSSYGNASLACRVVGINRSTHYRWLKNDNKYAIAIDEVYERRLDESEAILMELIAKGNTKAIIFYLTTKGKHRGYNIK